jgi:DNA polymerase-3 subunit delta'
MKTENTLINEDILERFRKICQKDRLAHAYLFVGPQSSGKYATALAVAKLLNCLKNQQRDQDAYCDVCANCQKISTRNHPDVHVLESGLGTPIKIEAARELITHMQMRPFSADRKIFIIQNIENLTKEASNAILKTLEEPTPDSLMLLTTSVIEKNLDTVRSRCHLMPFASTSQSKLADRLTQDEEGHSTDSHFLAYFSEGCLGKAQRYRAEKFFDRKNEMIDHFILSKSDDRYTKKILQEKETTKEFVDVLLSWIHDSLLIKVGLKETHVINRDRFPELQRFQSRYAFDELCDLNRETVRMAKLLSENLNIKIPLMIIKEKLVYG